MDVWDAGQAACAVTVAYDVWIQLSHIVSKLGARVGRGATPKSSAAEKALPFFSFLECYSAWALCEKIHRVRSVKYGTGASDQLWKKVDWWPRSARQWELQETPNVVLALEASSYWAVEGPWEICL